MDEYGVTIAPFDTVSNISDEYVTNIAEKITTAASGVKEFKTLGLTTQGLKNIFSAIGVLAAMNLARKNKGITVGLLGAGFILLKNSAKQGEL
jgi:hypothetical protein